MPTALRPQLMKEFHETEIMAHRGSKIMNTLMEQRMYWPGMRRDIEEDVNNCDECGDSKVEVQVVDDMAFG